MSAGSTHGDARPGPAGTERIDRRTWIDRSRAAGGAPSALCLSALALAACGSDEGTDPAPEDAPAPGAAFSYRQSGGIAGVDHLVAVSTEDEVTVSLQREEPIAVEVKPALVAKTRKELEATDLAGLQASERESPVPDSFRFDLTYGELRINGGDVALGELEALQPALDALNELLAAAIEARGEGLRAPTDQS